MFRAIARDMGGETHFHEHPLSRASGQGEFGIDTAWFGPRDASKVLVMISGTHGPELLAGTAMQLRWMQQYSQAVDAGTAVLLIHAANPYGCAHIRRTTERNVDLNRNFCDFSTGGKAGTLTHKVQDMLSYSGASGPRTMKIFLRLFYLICRHGIQDITEEIAKGQYVRADGVGYGGMEPEWANRTIRSICKDHFSAAKHIAIIDWHTGIGSYGEPTFLCFDEPGTPESERVVSWFGKRAMNAESDYVSGERPNYQGLLVLALQNIARELGAQTTALVIEFGTYSNTKMLRGLIYDRWLQNAGKNVRDADIAVIQDRLSDLFYPPSENWQKSVEQQGDVILCQVMSGLGKW